LPTRVTGGRCYAALDHGHFGVKLHRSTANGWEEIAVQVYPPMPEGYEEKDMWGRPLNWSTARIWALACGSARIRATAGPASLTPCRRSMRCGLPELERHHAADQHSLGANTLYPPTWGRRIGKDVEASELRVMGAGIGRPRRIVRRDHGDLTHIPKGGSHV
jgi:hypothetical protein